MDPSVLVRKKEAGPQDKAGHTCSGNMGPGTPDTNTGSTEPGRSRNSDADTDISPPAYSQALCV